NGRGSRNDSIQQDRGGQPRVNDNRDRFDRSSYKPPLEMNKPVVTPRDERRISAPSYTQDSRHNSYSPPPPPRSEVHSVPPQNPGGGDGGMSRPSGGGSSGGSHNTGSSSHGSGSSGGNHSSGGNNGGSKDSGSGKHQR